MKKTIPAILLCSILLIGTSGCGMKATIKENAELNETEGVSMTIKKGTLTKTSATVIIHDINGKGTYIYGEAFRIDQKVNGVWKEVEKTKGNYAFNAMAYYVDNKGKLELKQNWSHIYGKLKKGEYRLVKDTFLTSDIPVTDNDKLYFSVEFIIG